MSPRRSRRCSITYFPRIVLRVGWDRRVAGTFSLADAPSPAQQWRPQPLYLRQVAAVLLARYASRIDPRERPLEREIASLQQRRARLRDRFVGNHATPFDPYAGAGDEIAPCMDQHIAVRQPI